MSEIVIPVSINTAIRFEIFCNSFFDERLFAEYIPTCQSTYYVILELKISVVVGLDAVNMSRDIDLSGTNVFKIIPFPGESVTVYDQELTRVVDVMDGDIRVVCHYSLSETEVPYHVFVLVLNEETALSPERLILRIVRDIMYHILHRNGYILFHGSLVASDRFGVSFVAPKNGGKSTWLLHSMGNGWDYVANDRYFLNIGNRHAIAFPIAALIHKHCVGLLPDGLRARVSEDCITRSDHKKIGYMKIGFTPRELAEAYGVGFKLDTIVDYYFILNSVSSENIYRSIEHDDEVKFKVISDSNYSLLEPTYKFGIYGRSEDFRDTVGVEKDQVNKFKFKYLDFNRNTLGDAFVSSVFQVLTQRWYR